MRTIIFDFDGTIADTSACILETMRLALTEAGYRNGDADPDFLKTLIGLPLNEMFVRATGISDAQFIDKAMATYRKIFAEVCKTTVRLFPDVKATLARLKADGYTLAVATSRSRNSLDDLLRRLDIEEYFDIVRTNDDVVNKKPAPDLALAVLAETGTPAGEAMVVGDTTYDIEMGNSAGTFTCAVTYGNHDEERLRTSSPNAIIDSFARITELL